MVLYVSVLLPFLDGSGKTQLLGVYSNRAEAEARCYRKLMQLGYEQPTAVIDCFLNLDL